MLAGLRRMLRRRKYRRGAQLTRFIARDIRRDVEIVDDSEVDDGFVVARIRTWNGLYAIKLGHAAEPFRAARRIAVAELWKWTGHVWGGPVPDE
jgi:hypothetical protein